MTDDTEADDSPDLFGDESDADGATGDPTEEVGADEETADSAEEAPLDGLAREVRARRKAQETEEAFDADAPPDDDPFESVDVDHVDEDAVWEAFVEGETGPEEQVGLGSTVEQADEPDEHVVPKTDFCQRCPHFADPPETACTHEGTTIVEVVDADHFRVRNCPIVEDGDAVSLD